MRGMLGAGTTFGYVCGPGEGTMTLLHSRRWAVGKVARTYPRVRMHFSKDR